MNLEDRTRVTPRKADGRVEETTGHQTTGHQATGHQTGNHNAQIKRGIGVFADYQTTDKALRELKDIGYGMDHVSIIGQDSEYLNRSNQTEDAQVQDIKTDDGNHADDGATTGAISGGAVGGITGLLVGLGTLAIPGIGPIMLAGAAATAIASTAAGGAIGAATGGLVGALVGLGIPEDRAKVYKEHLSDGKYLVIIDGTDSDIARAEPVLKGQNIREWDVYAMADQPTTTHNSSPSPRGIDNRGAAGVSSDSMADQSATTRNSSTPLRGIDDRGATGVSSGSF